mmetsp:Transcript_20330/g.30941  ORF Transcript_20330/g.30941 Transcript_20330/m.30941 type:complete len:204 (+) Transcript_20330:354-965(+)|eukprot:CAMPEP_0118695072 /NCGR_PEP_ID=MMETSP0800-20121206/12954_1 /TAXON_ID=210618 ORGANISM="Striatella unipunctata, Strain CCMP2910" /NCGR_SAMPLE_ID=MMETSP0800 /ASSEMBLY_ACC=CAM_ASM_000638 /LENGTH=203 /DNA_ID=CAMNT_0006593765 /DNA_START=243 /DNA_END=854 /DNA_ORIENTATION=+
MLSDRTKAALLIVLLVGCISTLFTSQSAYMGSRDLHKLSPNQNKYCKELSSNAKQCLEKEEADNNNSNSNKKEKTTELVAGTVDYTPSCTELWTRVTDCHSAVNEAYKAINMHGCARRIQAVIICEVEWCDPTRQEPLQELQQPLPQADKKTTTTKKKKKNNSCEEECERVRRKLRDCVDDHVHDSLQKAGLTLKQQTSVSSI